MSFIGNVRRAVLLGLSWAVVWAPIAVLLGITVVDPDNSMDEMWVAIGAYPGFLCGVLFFVLLGLGRTRQKLHEVNVSLAAVLGAVSGLVVGLVPVLLVTPAPETPPWLGAAAIGVITISSVLSAIASVRVARMAKSRELRGVATR